MLKRRIRLRMNVRPPGRIRSPSHLAWVRGHECAIAHHPAHFCEGKIEAHHVREDGNAGTGLKPDDSETVPLCAKAHRYGHDKGWASFAKEFAVNLMSIAMDLWRRSPHRIKWEQKQMEAAQ